MAHGSLIGMIEAVAFMAYSQGCFYGKTHRLSLKTHRLSLMVDFLWKLCYNQTTEIVLLKIKKTTKKKRQKEKKQWLTVTPTTMKKRHTRRQS